MEYHTWGVDMFMHSLHVTVALACAQDGESCLYKACRQGHLEVVKYLYEQGGKELLMLRRNVSRLWACACALASVLCLVATSTRCIPLHYELFACQSGGFNVGALGK
jgi:hypothetical protein